MVKHHRNEELATFVSARLRELRNRSGLSQEKVLFETGVYVERIEKKGRNITISTLITLCNLYGVTLHRFFDPSNDHEQETRPQ